MSDTRWALLGYPLAPVPVRIIRQTVGDNQYRSEPQFEVEDATGRRHPVYARLVFDHEPQLVTESDDQGEYTVWR